MHDNYNFNYYYHFPADLTYPTKNTHMWTVCQHFRIDYEKSESYLINMTDWSVIFMQNPPISAIMCVKLAETTIEEYERG
jgi:hypothetical protein